MAADNADDVVTFLKEVREGKQPAVDRMTELVYGELRNIARALLHREKPGHTLQPTALVHEAYVRMAGQATIDWNDRAHFIALAAITMRRVLVDHARGKLAEKRGGALERISLCDEMLPAAQPTVGILDIDAALNNLARVDARRAHVASLRIFGGLEPKEVAEALGISRRMAERDWLAARAWLNVELGVDRPIGN